MMYSNEKSLLLLPFEVLMNIFKHLQVSDLRNVMLTCKTLKDIIRNESALWRYMSKKNLVIQDPSIISHGLSWYHMCRISHNWCKGIYESRVVINHRTNYMPWIQMYDGAIYLSVGSELRYYFVGKKGLPLCNKALWSVEVPKIPRHDKRTNDISRFLRKNNIIVCGNRDGCIAIYQLLEKEKRPQLLNHIVNCHADGLVEVTAVEIIHRQNDVQIITASNDSADLCLWQLRQDDNINLIQSGKKSIFISEDIGIRCMALNQTQDMLIMGPNGNSKPILLDVITGTLLFNAEDTKDAKYAVRDIQWHNNNSVVFVTHSGSLQFMDVRTGGLVYSTRDPFLSSLYCVKTDGDRAIIVGSSQYSRCVLFDIRTTRHVQMYFTQSRSSPVYSLDFDNTRLVAAADRAIAALNFNIPVRGSETRDYSQAFQLVK